MASDRDTSAVSSWTDGAYFASDPRDEEGNGKPRGRRFVCLCGERGGEAWAVFHAYHTKHTVKPASEYAHTTKGAA